MLFVEKEPSGDGEEDDDADFTAALHHELEEDAFRSQGEFQHVIAVVDDEVVHEDHEHRDDAQQLDAGIPACLTCTPLPLVLVLWLFSSIILLSPGPSLSRKFYGGGTTA